jgi:hypothetical protein
MNFGWEQNIWGGIEFKAEGSVMALLVLFFGTLSGVLYRQRIGVSDKTLTAKEQELVDNALQGDDDPRVIVVKQEVESDDNNDEEDDDEYEEYDYAYPYYFDENDDYEYEFDDDED